jgi:hypothetical protein
MRLWSLRLSHRHNKKREPRMDISRRDLAIGGAAAAFTVTTATETQAIQPDFFVEFVLAEGYRERVNANIERHDDGSVTVSIDPASTVFGRQISRQIDRSHDTWDEYRFTMQDATGKVYPGCFLSNIDYTNPRATVAKVQTLKV